MKGYNELHDNYNFTFVEVAVACNTTERTVQNWYKGSYLPKIVYLPGLKKVYKLPYNKLVPILLSNHNYHDKLETTKCVERGANTGAKAPAST